eukprot:Ihof_evm1s27 gene=Ihof_evmTU1s27
MEMINEIEEEDKRLETNVGNNNRDREEGKGEREGIEGNMKDEVRTKDTSVENEHGSESTQGNPSRATSSLAPVTTSIQRIILYETKTRYYVVGATQDDEWFRVMKIDRTVPCELVIIDDKIEYTKKEIHDLLATINEGNIGGLKLTQKAWGILGFIRFLEGYSMILITKRRRKGMIGGHYLYEIQSTKTFPIHISPKGDRHNLEQRYKRMFQLVDITSNFYFSYTYDLTNTLQYNMTMYTKSQ